MPSCRLAPPPSQPARLPARQEDHHGHALQQGAEGHFLTRAQAHAVAWGLGGPPADPHRPVPLRPPRLEILTRQVEGHQLDEAGRGMVLGRILGEEHGAVGGEEQDGLRAQVHGPVTLCKGRSCHEEERGHERDEEEH